MSTITELKRIYESTPQNTKTMQAINLKYAGCLQWNALNLELCLKTDKFSSWCSKDSLLNTGVQIPT
jgi:hypothetical protein